MTVEQKKVMQQEWDTRKDSIIEEDAELSNSDDDCMSF